MTMRETIARVLAYRAYGHEEPADKYFRDYLGTADAVLDAMREPTLKMLEKAEDAYVPTYTGTPVAAPPLNSAAS